jgi:hypothetical protein
MQRLVVFYNVYVIEWLIFLEVAKECQHVFPLLSLEPSMDLNTAPYSVQSPTPYQLIG